MADQSTININVEGNIFVQLNQLKQEFVSLNKKVAEIEGTSENSFAALKKSVSKISMVSITEGIQNVTQAFSEINAPGLAFGSSMAELSALTGVTGSQLKELGESAKQSASEFGGSASASLETYKTILGRLGPDIAKNKEALTGMEKNVQILSKTMGGDSAGAVDALTTAMLQFGVDLSDPMKATGEMSKMMDVMANSAQEGAAEVPSIAAALKVSGVALKQAKVSFTEANAAIQALAKGGKEGSEAGMALRNVLGKMAGEDVIPNEAAEKLKKLGVKMKIVSDTSLPFTDRLRELKKAEGDATIMEQVFGEENAAGAKILLDSVDAQDELRGKIGKTGGAMEQANIVMESTEEKVKRMNAVMENMKITIFESTGGWSAYLTPVSDVARQISAFVPVVSLARSGISKITSAFKFQKDATEKAGIAQKVFNMISNMNPYVRIATLILAAGGGILALASAFNKASAAEQTNAKIKDLVAEKTVNERTEVTILFDRLRNAKKGTDDYNKALKDLNDKYPDLIDKFDLHKGKIDDINKAEQYLMSTIQKRAEVEARAEVYKEMVADNIKEQNRIDQMKREGKGYSSFSNGIVWGKDSVKDSQKALEEKKRAAKALLKQLVADEKNKANEEPDSPDATDLNPPAIPGLNPPGKPKPKTDSGNETVTATGGGGEKRNINVRIEKLVDKIEIHTSNVKTGLSDIKKQVTEAMVSAVRDFEIAM